MRIGPPSQVLEEILAIGLLEDQSSPFFRPGMPKTVPGERCNAAVATDILDNVIYPVQGERLSHVGHKQIRAFASHATKGRRQGQIRPKSQEHWTRGRNDTFCRLHRRFFRPSIGRIIGVTKDTDTVVASTGERVQTKLEQFTTTHTKLKRRFKQEPVSQSGIFRENMLWENPATLRLTCGSNRLPNLRNLLLF